MSCAYTSTRFAAISRAGVHKIKPLKLLRQLWNILLLRSLPLAARSRDLLKENTNFPSYHYRCPSPQYDAWAVACETLNIKDSSVTESSCGYVAATKDVVSNSSISGASTAVRFNLPWDLSDVHLSNRAIARGVGKLDWDQIGAFSNQCLRTTSLE